MQPSAPIRLAVLGAGWGSALAVMAHRHGHTVTLWSPFEEEIAAIRRHGEHKKLLPGVPMPAAIGLTTDLACVAEANLVILAVPSFAIADTAAKMNPYLRDGTIVVNASKGLQSGTHRRFSQVLRDELPGARIVVLSGPSHAEEVARGVPTSIISASEDIAAAEQVQTWLMNPDFRIYVHHDVTGVELGGALKNIIALAAGMADGLDIGDNAKAALMTRGLAEIARLGVSLGAQASTFAGLSGMGDLIVTCGSLHSRNRRAGILIGQGTAPQEAVRLVGTVEGYHAAQAGWELAQAQGVQMPITEQVCRICYGGQPASASLQALMCRPCRHETEQPWMTPAP